MEELSLVDIKTNNGWFTWVNNREMMNMVTERLDMILVLNDSIGNMSYLVTKMVRQSKLDHDKILMDTMGSKPCENFKDPKLLFKYDGCWAKDKEAREIINRIWIENNMDILNKMDRVHEDLGPWQYKRYRRMKNQIRGLKRKIDKLVDGPNKGNTSNTLKSARLKLGHLYAVDEGYWAQMARIKWLTEGDKNTHYFHVRATGRKKKNHIEKLKDSNSSWQHDKRDICKVAWDYFNDLFKSTTASNDEPDLYYIQACITENMNSRLERDFINDEITATFNQNDPRKAPRIYDLCFFKAHWEVVGLFIKLYLKSWQTVLKKSSRGLLARTRVSLSRVA
ncbi:hypothetical protein V6Z11_D13G112700 [Gossypium hirsutum]|uniref:Uncharacterized protein n=1 Tax=Gossypium hirsutum TaxID=3635 RepID=A0A1U8MLX1_GOSHI|nr:uncharacterized protein LOC107939035 [Gossypium hirsutum]